MRLKPVVMLFGMLVAAIPVGAQTFDEEALLEGLDLPNPTNSDSDGAMLGTFEHSQQIIDELRLTPPEDCDDCIQQVVSPKAATDAYGRDSREWEARVTASETTREAENKTTCQQAITLLFNFACGGHASCNIEAAYAEKCPGEQVSEARQKACLKHEADYVDACFGEGRCVPLDDPAGNYGLVLSADGGEPKCSAAMVNVSSVDGSDSREVMGVTAQHCLQEDADWILRPISLELTHIALTGDASGQGGRPEDLVFATPGHGQAAHSSAAPGLFRETVFLALNGISFARHKMAQANSLSRHTRRYFLCDRSPLCTVVRQDGDSILHTCQSSRGGSGGALVQIVRDGEDGDLFIVGFNQGSESAGQVSENLGTALSD